VKLAMSLRVFQTIFLVLGFAVMVHAQQVAFPLTTSAQTPQPIPIETALPPFQFLQKPAGGLNGSTQHSALSQLAVKSKAEIAR
jgi:hypothetical protein